MKIYLTQRTVINDQGELIVECGENIHAINETWADIKCPKGFTIIGELLMEIPENNLEADFDKAIDYDEN